MTAISLYDAWQRWLGGDQIDPQLTLGWMSILWWGRLGKLAAFVGGLTVILDIVGPDRLRGFGYLIRPTTPSYLNSTFLKWAVLTPIGGFIILVSAEYGEGGFQGRGFGGTAIKVGLIALICVTPGILLMIFLELCRQAARLVAYILDNPNPAFVMRVTAVALFVVGFHFDLLAS